MRHAGQGMLTRLLGFSFTALALTACVTINIYFPAAAAEEARLDRLPFLDLPRIKGERLATGDLRGSKVLLVEFASW